MPADYHTSWVLANGVQTHYAWAGVEGPAIVLLHGTGPGNSGALTWKFQLPALAAAGFRAYAPDQLSMGLTDARPHAWPVLGHQSLVQHVRDFVDALCLDQVFVVGSSQGTYVAFKYALDCPERVRAVVGFGSATLAAAMGVERSGPPTAGMLALAEYDYSPVAMRRFLVAIVTDPATVTDEVVAQRHAMATRSGVAEARRAFDDYQTRMRQHPTLRERFSLCHSLPASTVPARIIWGKRDRMTPLTVAEKLARLLPNIPFTYLETGHQCQEDDPATVNRLMVDFFASVNVGSAA